MKILPRQRLYSHFLDSILKALDLLFFSSFPVTLSPNSSIFKNFPILLAPFSFQMLLCTFYCIFIQSFSFKSLKHYRTFSLQIDFVEIQAQIRYVYDSKFAIFPRWSLHSVNPLFLSFSHERTSTYVKFFKALLTQLIPQIRFCFVL